MKRREARATVLTLLRCGFAFAAALILASCAGAPQRPAPQSDWQARRLELQQRERFELRGKLAVAAGQEGFNARLRWVQQASHSQLSLDGPMGVGGAQIDLDGEALSVRNSKGDTLSDAAAHSELRARLGFEPPLASLRYWIQGVPDPATPSQESLDAQNRLATLVQDGWQIAYASYRQAGAEWLPERLTLQREAIRVRLFVDGWNP